MGQVVWDGRPAAATPSTEWWEHTLLMPGERVMLEIRPSVYWEFFYLMGAMAMAFPILYGMAAQDRSGFGAILGALFGTFCVWLAGAIKIWLIEQTRWAITNRRIIMRAGAFDKEATVIPLEKIVGVSMNRPLFSDYWQRASVTIDTAGGPMKEMVIHHQPDPDKIIATIYQAQSTA